MSDDHLLHDATERVGTVLGGKYRIDSVLGVGGMAVVYAATHRNRKRFAVKVLHAELSVRRDIRARFLREGYVANSVNHPGVVAVLDDNVEADGSAFLVMELLEGATVDALLSRLGGRLPVREALAVAYQLLAVLAVAHDSAIVHRDIKPANLFVSCEGRVKVLDFGIARLRDVTAGVQSTRAGAIVGTPSFMAPEQALAQGNEIDPRTDIWAVGATLFTMISGQFVHHGDNARQLLIRAATEPARSLANVAPETPCAVVDLVAKALESEKGERWQSAAAMRYAVERIHGELFGAFADEHLKLCLEQAPREFEIAHTKPSPCDTASVPGPPEIVRVATSPGTTPESPEARRRGAQSDVATTTSKPVSHRRREGGRRVQGKRAAVVASAAIVAGLTAGILAMKSVTAPPQDRLASASAASKGQAPPSQSTVALGPPAPQAIGNTNVPSTPPSSGESTSASRSAPTAPAASVAPLRASTPPTSSASRALPSGSATASSPPKTDAAASGPSADARKRDPLEIRFQ